MPKTTANLIVSSFPAGEAVEEAIGSIGVAFPILANRPVSWTVSAGVAPHTETYEVDAKFMPQLEAATGLECTLDVRVGSLGRPKLVVKKLVIVQVLSSGSPFTVGVVVADRRWFWARRHVLRRYNVRRRTGELTLVQEDQLGNVQDFTKIGYAAWSLHGGRPWKPSEVLQDVVNAVEGRQTQLGLPPGAFKGELVVQDLEIDDDGGAAIARALSYMPSVGVYVSTAGSIRFYDRLDKSEERVSERVKPLIVGTGFPRVVRNAKYRPRRIVFLFTREIEMRLDGVENRTSAGPFLALDNVLPVTDVKLALADGRTVLRGTWITVDEAIAAWAKTPLAPGAPGPIDLATVRKVWNPGFQFLLRQWIAMGGGNTDPIWAARLSSLLGHYRQTYRIRREFMDRIYDLDARRVGVIDPVTGTRAASMAWTDYTICVSDVGAMKLQRALDKDKHGSVILGYREKLDNGDIAPVAVNVVDSHVGIVRLDYRVDPNGLLSGIFPGKVENLPSIDPTGNRGPAFWNQIPRKADGVGTEMSTQHGVAVVLTLIPGAPNGLAQLQRIPVSAEEADLRLKETGIDAGILDSSGPPLHVRVSPTTMTAQFAWIGTAKHAEDVKKVLAIGDDSGLAGDFGDLGVDMSDAWVNKKECMDLAVATAAAMYAGLSDRLHGSRGSVLDDEVPLAGSIDAVAHSLAPNGVASTTIAMPPAAPVEMSAISFMSPTVRSLVLRSVLQT
jgi:hypothetical protein